MPKSCLYPGCTSSPITRGLCKIHYQYAYRLVQGGKTTWEQLEKEGKVAPKSKKVEEITNWFLNDKKPTRVRRIREGSK